LHSLASVPHERALQIWINENSKQLPECELKEIAQSADFAFPQRDRFIAETGLLYRLDRETSGIVLVALTRASFQRMLCAQNQGILEKYYLLVCAESLKGVQGSKPVSRVTDRAALFRNAFSNKATRVESYFRSFGERGARVACIAPDVHARNLKPITKVLYSTEYVRGIAEPYPLAENSPPKNNSLYRIEAKLNKGFRHQIRAHSAWMGIPILGDTLYGESAHSRLMLEAFRVSMKCENGTFITWKLYQGMTDNNSFLEAIPKER
jgi:23S rRNA-/tRNA-specific pseudouridylate synthase